MKPMTALLLLLVLVGIAPAMDSLNVRLVGYYLTGADRIAVERGYACILASHYGLRLISVADPDSIYEVGQFDDTSCRFSQAIIDSDYVYLPHRPSGVRVISIADPAHPAEVESLNTPVTVGDIAVAGQYAYMAAATQLLVVSIADPVHPVIVARCDTTGTAVGKVAVSGNYAYVMDFNQGLKVISVADPLHPVEVGHYDSTGMVCCLAASGNYLCAGDMMNGGLGIFSIADPANPAVVGRLAVPGLVGNLTMDGDTVYAAADAISGSLVISIKDPAHPLKIGQYCGLGGAKGICPTGNYIYVADATMMLILEWYQSGIEERPKPQAPSHTLAATVMRTLPRGAVAYDATGQRVVNPRSGVYFVSEEPQVSNRAPQTVRKVILQR